MATFPETPTLLRYNAKNYSAEENHNRIAAYINGFPGFRLVSKFTSTSTKMDFLHIPSDDEEGHIFTTLYRDFVIQRQRDFASKKSIITCSLCNTNRRKTTEEVKDIIEATGYTFVSTNIVDGIRYVNVTCKNGHNRDMSYCSVANRDNVCFVCHTSKP